MAAAFYTAGFGGLADEFMDLIFIEEFRAQTWIGLYPREKAMPQSVEISLRLGLSMRCAGESDDLGDTIDYAVVVQRLRDELAQRHFNLLEKLAEFIASVLLADFGAQWVQVSVAKLGMMAGVRRVGVCIERGVSPPGPA